MEMNLFAIVGAVVAIVAFLLLTRDKSRRVGDGAGTYPSTPLPPRPDKRVTNELGMEINALVKDGEIGDATRRLRDATGMGPEKADEFIGKIADLHGSYRDRGPLGAQETYDDRLSTHEQAEIVNLIRAGKKIGAIKLMRKYTGVGLRAAKEAVEDYAKRI